MITHNFLCFSTTDNFSKAPFDRSANPRPAGDREQRFNRRTRDENQTERRPYAGNNGAVSGDGASVDRPPRRANTGFQNGGGQGGAGGAPRRVFDRKSGSDKTGVKAVDKRDGGGAHNWGTHKQDIEDLNKSNSDWETDKEATSGASPASSATSTEAPVAGAEPNPVVPKEETAEQIAAAAAAAEAARLAEEEARELTLDEWKAQRGVRAKPQFNIRKAGEGEDTSQWKQMVALQSRKKNETDSDEDLEYDPSLYPQRVGRQKHLLNIEFNFNDGRRSGGNGPPRDARRGPGGPRNGGPDGRRPLPGGVRPPRRDQAQRNGGDTVAVTPAAATFEAAPFAETAAGAEEQPRLGAEPSRKPRAPRADERRRPYVSIGSLLT